MTRRQLRRLERARRTAAAKALLVALRRRPAPLKWRACARRAGVSVSTCFRWQARDLHFAAALRPFAG